MSAPWLSAPPPDMAAASEAAAEQPQPTSEELQKQLAMLGHRRQPQPVSDSSDEEPDSEEDERLMPPGPLDTEQCLVSGPGVSGGAAGTAVSFFVTAKDSKGKRIKEGGAYVDARVEPKSLAPKDEQVAVLIKDNEDGSYTGVYTVSARGNYELTVKINGTPTGGSPFPVFFSPPEAKPEGADGGSDAADAAITPANSLAATAQQIAAALQPDMARLNAANQAAAQILAAQNSMGGKAHSSGVVFPTDEEVQKRTVLVGDLSKDINPEQLRQLFGFCGNVVSCTLVGAAQEYAFVEYSKEEEATGAQAMNKMSVMGAHIRVEGAKSAWSASPQGAPDPFQALQAQQLAQMQLAQSQQESLAAQVAQIRASARQFPGIPPPAAVPNNSASQKAAALAAAAALSKRLTGIGGPASTFRPPSPRAGRAYSPPVKRSNRARSASPGSRHRRLGRTDNRLREAERRKEADRSTDRRSRSKHRSRSRDRRRRSKSREHRSSKKQDESSERRSKREGSPERRTKRDTRSKSPVRRPASKERDSERRRGRDGKSSKDEQRNRDARGERSSRKDEAKRSRRREERDGGKSSREGESDRHRNDRRRSPEAEPAADLTGDEPAGGSGSPTAQPAVDEAAPAPTRDAEPMDASPAAAQPDDSAADDAAPANGHADGDADHDVVPSHSKRRDGRQYRRSDAMDVNALSARKRRRSASPGRDDDSGRRREKHGKREKGEKGEKRKHKSRRAEKERRRSPADDKSPGGDRCSPAAEGGSPSGDVDGGAARQADEKQLRRLALEKFEDSRQDAE